MKEKQIVVAGKRKTAVAKARVTSGTGKVHYNGVDYMHLGMLHRLAISEPLKIAQHVLGKLEFDIHIKTAGGGKEGQIQAARLAVAKALVKAAGSVELKKAYMTYDRHLFVADSRRKEAYKPGDSKARASRQTSYR